MEKKGRKNQSHSKSIKLKKVLKKKKEPKEKHLMCSKSHTKIKKKNLLN